MNYQTSEKNKVMNGEISKTKKKLLNRLSYVERRILKADKELKNFKWQYMNLKRAIGQSEYIFKPKEFDKNSEIEIEELLKKNDKYK